MVGRLANDGCERFRRIKSWPNQGTIIALLWGSREKPHKSVSSSSSWDSNSEPFEYKSRVLSLCQPAQFVPAVQLQYTELNFSSQVYSYQPLIWLNTYLGKNLIKTSPSPVAAAAPTVPSAYAPAPGMGESPTLLKECHQMYSYISLLGVSAELLHHVSSRWANFHEIWYLSIFF